MNEQPIDVIVLAGGKNSAAMQAATGPVSRALTLLGEKTMLAYVVDALHHAVALDRIFVVGAGPIDNRYERVPGGETLMDNLLAGLDAAGRRGGSGPALIATSDIPFLTPASVDDFITRARAAGADLCYPIIPISVSQQRFPQFKRTTLKLREGTFTGGNLLLVNPAIVQERREIIMRAYAARKSVFQIGSLLGWGLLARLLWSQAVSPASLTLPVLEQAVGRVLGQNCRAAAIVTIYAEIGADIDRPEEIALARALLQPESPP